MRWTPGAATRTYADLQAQLGTRPAGFDQQSVAQAQLIGLFGRGGFDLGLDELDRTLRAWTTALAISCVVLVVLLTGIVIALLVRRRAASTEPDCAEYGSWQR